MFHTHNVPGPKERCSLHCNTCAKLDGHNYHVRSWALPGGGGRAVARRAALFVTMAAGVAAARSCAPKTVVCIRVRVRVYTTTHNIAPTIKPGGVLTYVRGCFARERACARVLRPSGLSGGVFECVCVQWTAQASRVCVCVCYVYTSRR